MAPRRFKLNAGILAFQSRFASLVSGIGKTLTCVKAPPTNTPYIAGMKEQPLIESQQQAVISLAEETRFAPNGIVSRTVLQAPNFRVVLFGFAEGQELTEHASTHYALIQILSGECEFSLDGQPHQLKAGAMLYMPPNLPHAVKATKQFSMLLTLSKPAKPEPVVRETGPVVAAAV